MKGTRRRKLMMISVELDEADEEEEINEDFG